MLVLKNLVTRRVREENASNSSLTRRVTKQEEQRVRSSNIDGPMINWILKNLCLVGIIVALAATGCAPNVPGSSQPREPQEPQEITAEPSASEVLSPIEASPEAAVEPITSIVEATTSSAAVTDSIDNTAAPSDVGLPIAESFSTASPALAIAVCPEPFQRALEPWVQRRRQEGMDVTIIASQPTAEALQQSLITANNGQCRYILLVGDSQLSLHNEPTDPKLFVPTAYIDADVSAPYQQSPRLPGDYTFGDFDRDGIIDAAVGRLPVKNAAELTMLINRVIAYEDSNNFGRWRSRVDLIAGIGGFGTLVDGAIEMVASNIITGSLPGSTRTRITHASPTSDFHPGIAEFTPNVLRNYEDGARFWVYAGHGWINELDRVPGNQFGRPVLSMSDLPNLRRSHASSPIALMLACYTGAFDVPEDCLAERMLLADDGPIAILAGSRVTMPYGNAATAIGLINAVYAERTPRLGDAWLKALYELSLPSTSNPALQTRRLMIDGIASILGGGARMDDERREHMQLYNWFGDPTLRISADAKVEIAKPADAVVGRPWLIQGTVPLAGELTIEIHRRLGSPLPTEIRSETRYQAANDTVLFSRTIAVQPGAWRCEIEELPSSLTDGKTALMPIIIKADLVGKTGFASGWHAAWLRSAPKQPNESPTSDSNTVTPTPISR